MDNIRFLILHSNTFVAPRVNEYEEMLYYLGALQYDTIVWLLHGETPVKAYKTLTSDNIHCKIYQQQGTYIVESADLQELQGFDCLLQISINNNIHDVVSTYTLPFVLSEVVKARVKDSISVLLNKQTVYQFTAQDSCSIDFRFDCFQQKSEGRLLTKLKIFQEDLEVKQAIIIAK